MNRLPELSRSVGLAFQIDPPSYEWRAEVLAAAEAATSWADLPPEVAEYLREAKRRV